MKTRRTILRGLAAAPVALAIPAAILPAVAAAASPDAALIAQAVAVEKLTALAFAALEKSCGLQAKAERLMPPSKRPGHMPRPDTITTTFMKEADGSTTYRVIPKAADPAEVFAYEERVAAIKAWDIEQEAVARRVGHRAADRKYNRLQCRLEVEADKLTIMVPTTLAGAVAKCRAAHALVSQCDPNIVSLTEGEHVMVASALHDLLAIGGAA